MYPLNDSRRGRSAAFRSAQKRSAEHRRCPKCDRKSAIVRHVDEGFGVARWCRWADCDYETFYEFKPKEV